MIPSTLSSFGVDPPSPYEDSRNGWHPLPGDYATEREALEVAAERGSRLQLAGRKPGKTRCVQDDRTGRWRVEVTG